jgi:hypothetical protein
VKEEKQALRDKLAVIRKKVIDGARFDDAVREYS